MSTVARYCPRSHLSQWRGHLLGDEADAMNSPSEQVGPDDASSGEAAITESPSMGSALPVIAGGTVNTIAGCVVYG